MTTEGMVVLKASDDDKRQRTQRPSSLTRQEAMKSCDVCAASLSRFLSFSFFSRPTVIGVARGLSDNLEISLLLERWDLA
jgi:hypothetical protein